MKQLVCGWLTALTLLGGLELAARGATFPEPAQEKGYLGVQIGPDKEGVELLSVRPGTAAEQAGLREGDVILQIGDQPVTGVEGLVKLLSGRDPGDRIQLKIRRGEQIIEQTVRLGQRPQNLETEEPRSPSRPEPLIRKPRGPAPQAGSAARPGGYLGVLIESSATDGALISDVRPESPAKRGRLQNGDLIVALDDVPISSAADLRDSIRERQPGEEVRVTILRDGEQQQHSVRLAPFEALSWPQQVAEEAGAPEPPALPEPAEPAEPAEPSGLHFGPAPGAPATGQGWIGIYFADADRGVRVDNTVPDSPAEQAGLEAGDVIISIDGARIGGSDALLASLRKAAPGQTVAVTVLRGSKPLEFDVRLGHKPDAVTKAAPSVPEATQNKSRNQRKAKEKARLARAKAQAAAKKKQARSLAKRKKAESLAKARQAKSLAKRKKAESLKMKRGAEAVAKAQQKNRRTARRKKAKADSSLGRERTPTQEQLRRLKEGERPSKVFLDESAKGRYVIKSDSGETLRISPRSRKILILELDGDGEIEIRVVESEDGQDTVVKRRKPSKSKQKRKTSSRVKTRTGERARSFAFATRDGNVRFGEQVFPQHGSLKESKKGALAWFGKDDDSRELIVERIVTGGSRGCCCCCCCCKSDGRQTSSYKIIEIIEADPEVEEVDSD